MSTRPLSGLAIVITLALCASWAGQQIAIKWALADMGPLTQGTVRSTGAAFLVGLYAWFTLGRRGWIPGLNAPGLVCGLIFSFEFLLIFEAVARTDAARVILYAYTAPFLVAVGGHYFIPGERLDLKSSLGVVVAFVGVAFAIRPAATTTEVSFVGDLMALAGGMAWGLTTLVIKGSALRTGPPAQVLFYQLGVSVPIFWLAFMLSGESLEGPYAPLTLASVSYQIFWVASISYGIWFALIARFSATSLHVITFTTPLMGVALGMLVLDEKLLPQHLIAAVAVALGILLVSLPRAATNGSPS